MSDNSDHSARLALSRSAPHGGAATVSGVWYQALWALLTAASARFTRATRTDDTEPQLIQLILEPRGGDVIVERPDESRVVQLKTLYRGTWSLKDVVVDVLPDLYRAVGENEEVDRFEFVTEGGFGRWQEAYQFFQSLSARLHASETGVSDAWNRLDDVRQMPIGGSKSAFWRGKTTERAVMDRIVEHLRETSAPESESLELTRRKTWRLMAGFCFTANRHEEDVRNEIDTILVGLVDHRDDLPNVRDAMVGWLVDRSRHNDAIVTPEELFAEQGLDYVVHVAHQSILHERCRRQIDRLLHLRDYRAEWYIRRDLVARQQPGASAAAVDPSLIAFTGESGTGKSWELFALARSSPLPAVVLLDACGDAQRSLDRAATAVWQEALGHEKAQSLSRIAARRQDVLGHNGGNAPWCLICIDQLHDSEELRQLLQTPFEEWGVRIAVACPSSIAMLVEEHARRHAGRAVVRNTSRFTAAERNEYLQRRLGDRWVEVPADVQDLLRTPLLANLYCELAGEADSWRPRNEYALVHKFFERLTTGSNERHRQDAFRLQRLAVTIVDGEPYPWSDGDLVDAGVDDEARRRLAATGWLRHNAQDKFEIPHERLLNFAVAQGLVDRCERRQMEPASVSVLLSSMLSGNARFGESPRTTVHLGYVPMDWFYLMLRDAGTQRVASDTLDLIHDQLHHSHRKALHAELLPTLDKAAVPLQLEWLASLAKAGQWWEVDPVIEGLAAHSVEDLQEGIERLLYHDSPPVCRVGLKLLTKKPFRSALHRAWSLHKEMQANPDPYFSDKAPESHIRPHLLYKDSFAALRECTRLAPDWLIETIRVADGDVDPLHDLAYLVANLGDDGGTWHACKADLLDKMRAGKLRSLALNAGVYCDHAYRDKLLSWVRVSEDHAGPAAVRALSRIDPTAAANALSQLETLDLYLCRGWFLPRLFLAAGEETRRVLHACVRDSVDPLGAVHVFQGFENEMLVETLDLVLDRLDEGLGDELATEPGSDERPAGRDRFYIVLKLLAGANRPELLDVFEARSGSRLEERLAQFLIRIGPRRSLSMDCLSREPALTVLLKIGGAGYRQVVSKFLEADTRYGRLDAVRAASKDADDRIIEKVRGIATGDERWDDAPVEQMEAMRRLAAHGDDVGVAQAGMLLGLYIPADLKDWLPHGFCLRDDVSRELLSVVSDRDPGRSCGALIVSGLARHERAMDGMIDVLDHPPNTDIEIAAIVALGHLGSAAEPAVGVIGERLLREGLRDQAVQALSRIGTRQARGHLLTHLHARWDVQLAVWLADFEETHDLVVQMIVARLDELVPERRAGFRDELQTILAQANDELLEEIVRCSRSVQERLCEMVLAPEGHFSIVGSKAGAIRGLATIDAHAAYLASRKALTDEAARDRHQYPPLMYRLRREDARDTFMAMAASERHDAVLWSMANALGAEDVDWLLHSLEDSSAHTRQAASRLAGGTGVDTPNLREVLMSLLRDRCEQVADAAVASLAKLSAADQVDALMDRVKTLVEEERLRSCWAVVDALSETADVGFKDGSWPRWCQNLAASELLRTQRAMLLSLEDRVRKRREKGLREANRVR